MIIIEGKFMKFCWISGHPKSLRIIASNVFVILAEAEKTRKKPSHTVSWSQKCCPKFAQQFWLLPCFTPTYFDLKTSGCPKRDDHGQCNWSPQLSSVPFLPWQSLLHRLQQRPNIIDIALDPQSSQSFRHLHEAPWASRER